MLTHPDIDPIAVSLGPVSIHWYGLTYLVGFAAAWAIAVHRSGFDYSSVKRKHVDDLIFYCALGAVLGGRFGYVMFYNFDRFLLDPLWLFKVWEGGMSFHGGLLGVFVAMIVFSRKFNIRLGALVDFVAPMAPVGLGMGRIGNFIGQELWGRPADVNAVPWAMIFPKDPSGLARHPSQLYQAFLEGGVLLLIVYIFSSRPRPDWSVGGLFLSCYGVFRFIIEFFRQPDSHIGFDAFGWLTRGQILSLPMIVGGIVLMVYAYRWQAAAASTPKSGKKVSKKNL